MQSSPALPSPRRRKQVDQASPWLHPAVVRRKLRSPPEANPLGAEDVMLETTEDVMVGETEELKDPTGSSIEASPLAPGVVSDQLLSHLVMLRVAQQDGSRPVVTSLHLTVVRDSSGEAEEVSIIARLPRVRRPAE